MQRALRLAAWHMSLVLWQLWGAAKGPWLDQGWRTLAPLQPVLAVWRLRGACIEEKVGVGLHVSEIVQADVQCERESRSFIQGCRLHLTHRLTEAVRMYGMAWVPPPLLQHTHFLPCSISLSLSCPSCAPPAAWALFLSATSQGAVRTKNSPKGSSSTPSNTHLRGTNIAHNWG